MLALLTHIFVRASHSLFIFLQLDNRTFDSLH